MYKNPIIFLLLGAGFIFQASAQQDHPALDSSEEPKTYSLEEVEIITNEVLHDFNKSNNSSEPNDDIDQPDIATKKPTKKPTGPVRGFVPKEALAKFKHSHQSSEANKQVNNLFKQAFAKEKTGDLSGALQLLTMALQLSPKNEQIRLAKGRVLVKSANYDSAVETLTPLSELEVSQWQAWYWKGSAELMLGRLLAAELSLDEALSREGSKSQIWLNRALVEQEREDHDSALQLLSIAHDLAPKDPHILLSIAYSSEAIGDLETARASYRNFLSVADKSNNTVQLRHIILEHLSEMEVPIATQQTNSSVQNQ